MVYDTGFTTKYPDHKCGRVVDYCIFNDTKILFCLFCKKVIGAKKDPETNINIEVKVSLSDLDKTFEKNEYDPENLESWI